MRSLMQMPGLRQLPMRVPRPRRNVVLFDSWHGRYSDSPRAIFEEMRRRSLPFEYVWVLESCETPPDGATSVAPFGAAHLAALGRSGYIVCNNTLPGFFRKRSTTTLVQSWHGTPLKRIAFDIRDLRFREGDKYLRALEREVRMWDLLISPNRFSTQVFRQAFRYAGEILESGYPRNDILKSPRAPDIRQALRAELGIDDTTRAVLYAPTWRDNGEFNLALDLQMLGEALTNHVILLRAHHLVAETVRQQAHPSIIDVSRHADPAELYLAADVLVTDYSSVMFDFALTGKPMVFYVYDLHDYQNRLRGFYFDFVADAPGPVVRTSGEVLQALRELDTSAAVYEDRYRRFVERFGHLDDGRASERVVDAVFEASAHPTS